ncbi:hypothetical protein NC651_009478 [Populus alba x Populus x berolinensis]|nr:hypothetical protein NC651_009478 [Populus alba x Populus x berolinensis]
MPFQSYQIFWRSRRIRAEILSERPMALTGKRSYALNRLQFPDIYGIRYSRISETDVGIL